MRFRLFGSLAALLLVGVLVGVPLLHAQGYSFNTASSWATVALSKSATMTAATSSVKRLIASQFTLTPTGNTLTMSPTTDSLAAIRGAITLTSGDTLAAKARIDSSKQALGDWSFSERQELCFVKSCLRALGLGRN